MHVALFQIFRGFVPFPKLLNKHTHMLDQESGSVYLMRVKIIPQPLPVILLDLREGIARFIRTAENCSKISDGIVCIVGLMTNI